MEASNLSDIEFKKIVIKVLKELSDIYKSIKKDIETIKRNQSEMKNTIFEMKNILQGLNNKKDEAEDSISYLENKVAENTQIE